MRPIYESQTDIDNEIGVAKKISDAWSCDVYKLPAMEVADFAIEKDGRYIGLMEVKCRNYSYDQLDRMGGLIISKRKIDDIFELAKKGDVFVVIAVMLAGVVYVMSEEALSDFEVITAGRRDRGDQKDIEKCYLIPMSRFEVL